MEEHTDTGMAGCRVYHTQMSDYIQQSGLLIDFDNCTAKTIGADMPEDGSLPDVIECDTVATCAVMVRADTCLLYTSFQVQTRSGASSTKYLTKHVESVTTNDQKIYDITLKEQVYATDYLKVTISALATNKSVEIYIDNISGYGDAGNTEVSYCLLYTST